MADLANVCRRSCTGAARVVDGLVQPCLACHGLSHNSRVVHVWLFAHSPPNKANFM